MWHQDFNVFALIKSVEGTLFPRENNYLRGSNWAISTATLPLGFHAQTLIKYSIRCLCRLHFPTKQAASLHSNSFFFFFSGRLQLMWTHKNWAASLWKQKLKVLKTFLLFAWIVWTLYFSTGNWLVDMSHFCSSFIRWYNSWGPFPKEKQVNFWSSFNYGRQW